MGTQKLKILYICNDLADSLLPGFYFSPEFNEACDFRVLVAKRTATGWSKEVTLEEIEASLDNVGIEHLSFGKQIKVLSDVFCGQEPDSVIFSNPYDDYREDPLKSVNLAERVGVYCFLYATFLSGSNVEKFFEGNEFFTRSQAIFVEKRIKEYPSFFIEVSSIKLFRFLSSNHRSATKHTIKGLSGEVRSIGFRPRWTITNSETLVDQIDYLNSLVSEYVHINVKFFIHPMFKESLDRLDDTNICEIFNSFISHPRVSCVEDVDYVPELVNLDLLISEPSTLIWDFLHTGKPYILLMGNEKPTSLGRKVMRYSLGSVLTSKNKFKIEKWISSGELGFSDRVKLFLSSKLVIKAQIDPARYVLQVMSSHK